MNLNLIHTLYDYNYWAHKLVWKSVMTLSDEDFERGLDYSWGSIKAQVVHNMSAEWMWFERLKWASPQSMFDPADFMDRQAIRTQWDEIEKDIRMYIAYLDDAKVRGTFSYTTTSGKSYKQRVGDILLHVVNHGTDHRAQTLSMLYTLGAPTVEQDLIFYLRERID